MTYAHAQNGFLGREFFARPRLATLHKQHDIEMGSGTDDFKTVRQSLRFYAREADAKVSEK
jgi:hypothetical protein